MTKSRWTVAVAATSLVAAMGFGAAAWVRSESAVTADTVPAAKPLLQCSDSRDPNHPFWVRTGNTAVCFAPDTPEEYVRAISNQLYHADDGSGQEFFSSSRWPGTQGSPVTLRWSLVPDGVQVPGLSGPSAASNLFAQMNAKFAGQGGQATWVALCDQVFERWEALGGTVYSRVNVVGQVWDDGAAWGTAGSSVRGDTRISGRALDGANGVLAFAQFPPNFGNGDVVIDMSESYGSSFNNFVFFRNVLAHEVGHTIGIQHVCPVTSTKLMEPFASTTFDGPRHDDIRAQHSQYGDRFENNDNTAFATNLGTINPGTPITVGTVPAPSIPLGSTVSIDQTGGGDPDFYRITTTGARSLTATVTPLGNQYDSSVETQSGCTSGNFVNSQTAANLAIQVIDINGVTVLATAQGQPAGQSETVANIPLNIPGNYFIRIFSTTVPSTPQLYSLTISVINQDCNNNGIPDPQDVINGATDCNSNQVPDVCEVAPICPTCPDCNADQIPDSCQVPPVCGACPDCNVDGVPDACQTDCNSNSRPDDCDITLGAPDCQPDGVPDVCQVPPLGMGGDCNANTVPDSCEVANGQAPDCNGNTVPDVCDTNPVFCGMNCLPDCNSNNTPDSCDLSGVVDQTSANLSPISGVSPQTFILSPAPTALGTVQLQFRARADVGSGAVEFINVQINGVPMGVIYDSAETHFDCPTFDDIDTLSIDALTFNNAVGPGGIANIQMIPEAFVDSCVPASFISVRVIYAKRDNDCNFNSVIDSCEIAAGAIPDCNANLAPDSCDIDDGILTDGNLNMVPDQCECVTSTCIGDLDENGSITGGDDVYLFVLCYIPGDMTQPPCACADMNADGNLNSADLSLYVNKLLGIGDPNPACP